MSTDQNTMSSIYSLNEERWMPDEWWIRNELTPTLVVGFFHMHPNQNAALAYSYRSDISQVIKGVQKRLTQGLLLSNAEIKDLYRSLLDPRRPARSRFIRKSVVGNYSATLFSLLRYAMVHGHFRIYTAEDNYYDYGLIHQIYTQQKDGGMIERIFYPPRTSLKPDPSHFHACFDKSRQANPYYHPKSSQLAFGFNPPSPKSEIVKRKPVKREIRGASRVDKVPILQAPPSRDNMGKRLRPISEWNTATTAPLFGPEEFKRRAARSGIRISEPA